MKSTERKTKTKRARWQRPVVTRVELDNSQAVLAACKDTESRIWFNPPATNPWCRFLAAGTWGGAVHTSCATTIKGKGWKPANPAHITVNADGTAVHAAKPS